MTIFKACDVRGIVGQEWDPEDARQIGGSLGHMLHVRGQSAIIVGGDFRRSTPSLKAALISGLRAAGMAVQDVGQVPTPVVQYAARAAQCRNLAIVTASHNPGRYNGIKFIVDGWPPVPALVHELESGCTAQGTSFAQGPLQQRDILADYERWVIAFSQHFVTDCLARRNPPASLSRAHRDSAGPRIAVDTMGGAFTGLAPRILQAAGYDVVTVDDHLDEDFARRDPNPAVDANLQQLVEAVRRSQAALGFALDGDGDRVILVDDQGTIARPEQIAAILIKNCLGRCRVVYDLKCASLVAQAVAEQGGRAIPQPSGHGFIKRKLLELQAELGVEVSGHHFFGALEGGDDGLFTALCVLHLLAARQTRLADWLREIGWPAITPDLRIAFDGDPQSTLETIAQLCGGEVTRMDGVRAEYDNGAWALGRASITEPAITFRFEGRTRDELRTIINRFLAGTPELCQRVLEKI